MLSGIQEILLIVAIIMAILFIPRMTGRNRSHTIKRPRPLTARFHLSGKLRLALSASLLWPLGAAIYLEPWREPLAPFLIFGLGPVLLCWSITWVMAGFMGNRRK